MRDLIREERSFGANPGTKQLARHLFTRMYCGKVVIVAANPTSTLPALRRQWLKLARKAQKERSSTLDATRVYELNQLVTKMLTLEFTTKWPAIDYPADVYIVTVEECLRWVPEANCRTLCITCDVESKQLYLMTAWMLKKSLIVTCKLA